MTVHQILKGSGVSATLDDAKVRLEQREARLDIPLQAVRETRVPAERVVEIVLTDGATHRVEGGNPTATAAFAEAVTRALPVERDPAGSALVTTEALDQGGLWGPLALLASPVLAYIGYAVWVAATHGVRVLGVIIGVLPLLFGIASLGAGVQETFRRVVLRQQGITVRAQAYGRKKRQTLYVYTDTDGAQHNYWCGRKIPEINIAYDPRKPERAAHAAMLIEVIARVTGLLLVGVFLLALGIQMAFGLFWD